MMGGSLMALVGAIVTVVLEPTGQAEMTRALLASCSSVFAGEGCVAADTSSGEAEYEGQPGHNGPPFRAEVAWAGNVDRLRAEVRLAEVHTGREWTRSLSFGAGTSQVERWEAIGLVLAALVNVALVEQRASASDSAGPVAPPESQSSPDVGSGQSPEQEADAAPGRASEPARFAEHEYALGVLVLGAGDPDLVGLGAIARATWGLPGPVSLTGALGFAYDGTPIRQLLLRPSVGVQAQLPLSHRARLMGLLEVILPIARFSAGDESQMGARSWEARGGVSLGLGASYRITPGLGMYASGAGIAVFPPLALRVSSSPVAEAGILGFEASAGLTWFLQTR